MTGAGRLKSSLRDGQKTNLKQGRHNSNTKLSLGSFLIFRKKFMVQMLAMMRFLMV
jgi:hypothetical protein